jgi:mono/diheme cytochrome c family protein
MRNFIAGLIFTLVVLILIGLGMAMLGYMPTNADASPGKLETWLANGAMDTSMERHAPRANNPVPATDANLIDGMKIYTMNCALCHGALDKKRSSLEHGFYPPPPQLLLEPVDDPEWHIFYAIRTGIRYTGMPAWGKALSEQDIWKVTAFLSRVERLPPGAKDYWQKAFGVSPEAAGESQAGHHHENH